MTRRWLGVFWVPAISARALAIFRAVFGLSFLAILLFYTPVVPRAFEQGHGPLADLDWIRTLATDEVGTSMLQLVGCASAVLFALGVFARISYVCLVAVLLLNATMLLLVRGVHDWDLPMVTLIALIAVPWGDAPSLFTVSRTQTAGVEQISRAYGFAIWLPGLTLGLAFAAAAYAKLNRSGLDWITGGAVRYHFVEDGANAPLALGLWIAQRPELAIALSLAAVLTEALFIAHVFTRDARVRSLFGLGGASLMAGFFVFQGVRWMPWWALFTAFLPWPRFGGSRGDTTSTLEVPATSMRRDLTWVHAGVVATLVASQVWASWRGIEIEPLLSNYPMYSYTYDSPEHFERAQAVVRFESDGIDITDRVRTVGDGRDALLAMVERQEGAGELDPDLAAILKDFGSRYAATFATIPREIDVIFFKPQPFDWVAGRYVAPQRERIGTVKLPQ